MPAESKPKRPQRQLRRPPPADYGPDSPRVTLRHRPRTWPRSTTAINWNRLPHAAALRGMALAYLAQPFGSELMDRRAVWLVCWLVLAVVLLSIAVSTVLPFFVPFLSYRTLMALLFASVTLWLVARYGATPFAWYLDWLYAAEPSITPATFLTFRLPELAYTLRLLSILLFLVVFVPAYSPGLAVCLLLGVCSGVLLWQVFTERGNDVTWDLPPMWLFTSGVVGVTILFPVSMVLSLLLLVALAIVGGMKGAYGESLVSLAQEVFRPSLLYRASYPAAPGVWVPREPLEHRYLFLFGVLLVLAVTLSIALYGFVPWDLAYADFFSTIRNLNATLRYREFLLRNLSQSTEGWVLVALYGVRHGELAYLWSFAVAIVLAGVLPLLVLITIYAQPLWEMADLRRRMMGYENQKGEWVPGQDQKDRTEWAWHAERLPSSSHSATNPDGEEVKEADHFFAGVEPVLQFPILIHKNIPQEGVYIMGEPGSGKTSLGVTPLLLQFMQPRPDRREYNPKDKKGPAPVVILDLKGDKVMLHTIRDRAKKNGQKFRFFTLENDKDCDYFNPFDAFDTDSRNVMEVCQLFLQALNLYHGPGYGRSFYSSQSRALLAQALQLGMPKDFTDLYRTLDTLRKKRENRPHLRDTLELMATIQALTFYPKLSTIHKPPDDRVIFMPRVMEQREVVYFWFKGVLNSFSIQEVGKLAVFAVMDAMLKRYDEGKHRQAVLAIDELQMLASGQLKVIMQQARGHFLTLLLANQTLADLKTPDADLTPNVEQLRMKLFFTFTEQEGLLLKSMGGEDISMVKSFTTDPEGGVSVTLSETLGPRLTRDTLDAVRDHPRSFFLHVSRGEGYTQFDSKLIPVETTWPIPLHLKQDYEALDWPPREKSIAPPPTTGPTASSATPPPQTTEEVDQWRDEEVLKRRAEHEKKLREAREKFKGPGGGA